MTTENMSEYEIQKAREAAQAETLRALQPKFEAIMAEELPGFWTLATVGTGSFGGPYMKIAMACSEKDQNVEGQKAQVVSLHLDGDLELKPQIYGGNGGQSIYRQPNRQDPSEQYLAMKRVKVPFRRPLPTEEAVLRAFRKFCKAYVQTLRDNVDVLVDQDLVDYKKLLNIQP